METKIVKEYKYEVKYKDNPVEYRRLQYSHLRGLHPFRHMFASAKSRAKKIGREFTISIDDLVVPDKCPIMGIPLFYQEGGRIPNSPSLDRVDNSKGYTPENTRVISWFANGRKGDLTVEQIDRLHAYVHGEV